MSTLGVCRWSAVVALMCLVALSTSPCWASSPGTRIRPPVIDETVSSLSFTHAPEAARWAKLLGGAGSKSAGLVRVLGDGCMVFGGWTDGLGASGGDLWLFKLDASGTPVWSQLYGTPSQDSGGAWPTPDGGYILHGATAQGLPGGSSWLIKVDGSGAIQWQKSYSSLTLQASLRLAEILSDGYLLLGTGLDMSAMNMATYAVKTDLSGNILWQYGYTTPTVGLMLPNVTPLSDSSLLLSGMAVNAGTQDTDLAIVCISSSGSVLWRKLYGGPQPETGGVITVISPYWVLLEGTTRSWGQGGSATGDIWLLQLDTLGNIQWQKAYGGTGDEFGSSLIDPAGGFLFSGATNSFGAGGQDAWVMKLDAAGSISWQKTYGGAGDDYGVAVSDTGGYLLDGLTSSFGGGGEDAWLVKLDAQGNVTWQKTYGGAKEDAGVAVRLSSGDLFVAGSSEVQGQPDTDLWFIHADSQGALGPDCTFIQGGTGATATAGALVTTTNASWMQPFMFSNPVGYASAAGTAAMTNAPFTVSDLCQGQTPSLSASASADKTTGTAPLAVAFAGSASDGTPPYTYEWDFGDGSAHASAQNPGHTFTAAGDYAVSLTVNDSASQTASDSHLVIHVSAPPCTLTCTATAPGTGVAGAAVAFASTVNATGCAGTPAFAWTFGDGATSSLQSPSHAYAAAGSYGWALTITQDGATCTKNGTIVISAGCTYALAPASKSFTSAAGSVVVTVTASGQASCGPPALSVDQPWVTATPTSYANNKGKVKVSVTANTSATPRSATVTVGGTSFAVTQVGAKCKVTAVSPTRATVAAAGGEQAIAVTATQGACSWTASPNGAAAAWITMLVGSGSGPGTATYLVSPNTTGRNRTGTISVATAAGKKTVTVKQTP